MQTNLPDTFLETDEGLEADHVLRKCVHCGFCLATCPTYQVLGDELDSPRGRIYLIKNMLEGEPVTESTQLHLDRCLTCQACETTCPSGVEYHKLLEIGRSQVVEKLPRPWQDRLVRRLMLAVLAHRKRFNFLLAIGQFFRPVMPHALKQKVPSKQTINRYGEKNVINPTGSCAQKVILFQGCVQPGLAPNINAAARLLLEKMGIESVTVTNELCCGAISHHLDAQERARETARRNIDSWWPYIDPPGPGAAGSIQAIVHTASGCGNFAREYADLLKHDPVYAEKAETVSGLVKDISEIIDARALASLVTMPDTPIAFHSPCTLQHGQKLTGVVEKILSELGCKLLPVADAQICCGSAGTYSILQKDLSMELRKRKLANLERNKPAMIATANIGCLMHMKSGTDTPVKHWIELVAEHLH